MLFHWLISANFNVSKFLFSFTVEVYKNGRSLNDNFSCGLALDWLEILDPEIVHVDPLLQRELLFMNRDELASGSCLDKSKTSASYLRALLAHQSKDTTLLDCLDWLLSIDVIGSRYDIILPFKMLLFCMCVTSRDSLSRLYTIFSTVGKLFQFLAGMCFISNVKCFAILICEDGFVAEARKEFVKLSFITV